MRQRRKDIIINVSIGETRIAILEHNKLVELYFELPENDRMVGDIYYGKVAKVVKGMQAAFIDIGKKQDAFLHFSDMGDNFVDFLTLSDAKFRASRQRFKKGMSPDSYLRAGQHIFVQITKEPIAHKGARVTTNLSLPGRFLVLMPFDNVVGVSRKIIDRDEKIRLKKLGRSLQPEKHGMVIRTVSARKPDQAIKSDLDLLIKAWNEFVKKVGSANAPCLLHKDMGMLSSVIRDLFTEDVDRLIVDNKRLFKQIEKYLKDVSSGLKDRLELYQKKEPIFDEFGIESQITKSLARKVWLRSGGYIFIDHTEALTAIDVNSGRFLGSRSHDSNSLKINLEAAREIARQLRLRDIGGIIINDFIDMTEEKNKKRLQEEFARELRKDRSQVNITPISEFGIIEMTRERVRPALLYSISEPCPACMGTGRVISKSTVAARIERWVKRYRSEKSERSLQLIVHPELARFLKAGYKNPLRRISWKFWTRIKVIEDDNMNMEEFKFLDRNGEEDLTPKFMT